MTTRVALIGECMIELRHLSADRLALGYAGDVFNTAAYLVRSAEPGAVDVQFVSVTGDDPYSLAMREHWRAYGVHDTYTRTLPGGKAGLYLIRTDARGERTFQHYRRGSAARELFGAGQPAEIDEAIASHDLVYLSGITLSIMTPAARARLVDVLAETRRRGGRVAYDGNYRPSGWSSPRAAADAADTVLAHTDIALPSLDDDRLLHGDTNADACITRLREAGVREIVVKLGERGCVIADERSAEPIPAVPEATVVDTTSAGDAFNGAYLAARLAGTAPRPAAEAGARLAAEVIGHPGALLPA
ncbi:sugar kinase [Actinomadura rudentiformis]|uniref:Sugar kinase n=1 Tax=Actinomadura rudentiformis TaxID=359158 RepID=A0A6H9YPD8_9ACTN|nr:sugar kinase [Actinomadura rudentiformis]KAB2343341.1 sugar kinase [Actinomadura rudentiformis]